MDSNQIHIDYGMKIQSNRPMHQWLVQLLFSFWHVVMSNRKGNVHVGTLAVRLNLIILHVVKRKCDWV